MASQDTKDRILLAALRCFNQDGIANVRLQHIADTAGMSVGNMAYHFRTKEVLTEQLYQRLRVQLTQLLDQFRIVPLFEYWDQLFAATYQLQSEYRFFYLDMLEVIRTYPEIGQAHQAFISVQKNELELSLRFNAARGALWFRNPEQQIPFLAGDLGAHLDLWAYRQATVGRENPDLHAFREDLWQVLFPHFSEIGHQEWIQMLQLREPSANH